MVTVLMLFLAVNALKPCGGQIQEQLLDPGNTAFASWASNSRSNLP
jgi:hypothetical protein